jgi:lipoprotein-anchoring transpeptidase ErfK/SrfK
VRPARARALLALTAAAATAAVSACAHTPDARQVGAGAAGTVPGTRYFSISPGSGATGAGTASGITVDAENGGKITGVTVTTKGDKVTGALNAAGTEWHSAWALNNATRYTVTADGTSAQGHPVTATSTFTTQTPKSTFRTLIYEGYNQTYGVGMPIMLTFSQPVKDKAAVERALTLTTSKPVIGSWYWDGDEHVYFRPRDYWPADTAVSLDARLNGVDAGDGVYGAENLTQTFDIGQSVIAVASTSTHQTQIYVGGQLRYNWPISTGRTTMPTPDGTYLTVQKGNPVRMIGGKKGTPGYYNEMVNYAVRFTFSGDYYHAAPWSVVSQGFSNVSHGCVNLSPADAKIYYKMVIPGDPITIASSPRGGVWDNGWTEWFYDWQQYLAGSATHMAVEAGPGGSRLVSPSAVPSDTATAPLGTSSPGNYQTAG